jgi:GTP-binding protein
LVNKPRWLVLNKIDHLSNEEVDPYCQTIIDALDWTGPVFKISALKNQGTQELMFAIMNFLEERKLELQESTHESF